jgi:hypothetical protein
MAGSVGIKGRLDGVLKKKSCTARNRTHAVQPRTSFLLGKLRSGLAGEEIIAQSL